MTYRNRLVLHAVKPLDFLTLGFSLLEVLTFKERDLSFCSQQLGTQRVS
jgi:hypothetical protein